MSRGLSSDAGLVAGVVAGVIGGLTAGLVAGCLPEETVIGAAVPALVSSEIVLIEGAQLSARDAVPLVDGSLVVNGTVPDGTTTRSVLVLARPDGRAAEVLGDGDEVGVVRAVVVAGAVTIVVGEAGVVGVENGALFRVPIAPMLAAMDVRTLAPLPAVGATGDIDFLIATDAGLYVVVGDQASAIRLDGAPLIATHLATRPGTRSAWAADDEGLLRITLADRMGDAPTLSRLARGGEITALASDAEGRPWWVEDGTLYSMTRDLRVIARVLPMEAGVAPTDVTSIADDGELWVHGSDTTGARGALFHYDGHEFRAVQGAIGAMTIRCATGSECVGFDGTGELARIAIRHAVSVDGLVEGMRVHEPITLTITAEAPTRVTSIRATIGSVELPVAEGGRLQLDPAAVGYGPRMLSITVAYSDGTLPRTVRRTFISQAPATWSEDIEPLYRAECVYCHAPGAGSSRTLDTRESWMREIDRILPAIDSGAMPLERSRLPATTVALVRAWAEAGFAE